MEIEFIIRLKMGVSKILSFENKRTLTLEVLKAAVDISRRRSFALERKISVF
jgi:hypothetical protein